MRGAFRFYRLLVVFPVAAAAQFPPGYTDPGACAACHADIAASYAATPMARTFGTVPSGAQLPPLDRFAHEPSGQIFTLLRRGGKSFVQRRETSNANALERAVDYWIGSGNHARSYASRTVAGDLIELPVTWYAEKQGYWAMSPAYDTAQHPGFSRRITYRCMFCHNAYPDLPPRADRWDNATRWPDTLPSGIDCQRCHGPGKRHVETARGGGPVAGVRAAIVNPARLDVRRRTEVCLQCHLETTNRPLPGFLKMPQRGVFSYRPGEALAEYGLYFDHAPGSGHDDKLEFASAPYRMRQSRCFLESAGRLTCTTCHNPHGTTAVEAYDRACLGCHASLGERHPPRRERCASCHMPSSRPEDAIHVTISDHRIVRRPSPRVEPERESNASTTPPYRGPVVLYYPERIADGAKRDLWTAVAQVASQSNLAEGIPRLEQAIARWKPADSDVYSYLAGAYRPVGRDPRSLYAEALRRDPENLAALVGSGREADLRRALGLAPWNHEIHKALAAWLTEAGRVAEALDTLRAVTDANPEAGDLHNSLGLSLLRTGAAAEAERSLREAVRLRPEVPAIRANLATLLARRDNWPDARYEFEQAIRLGAQAEVHSAYGMALLAQGDPAAARRQFEAALALKPELWNTRNSLGTVLERSGDRAAAIGEYRAAVASRPDFALGHFNLGVALAAERRFAEARDSLQTAARLARQAGDGQLAADAEAALRNAFSAVP